MGKIGKTLTLSLTLIIVLSSLTLLTVKTANAQSIPKPTVPEFTAEFVNSPYEVPAHQGVNIWTGQNYTIPSQYLYNSSIELTITNQPFSSYVFNNQTVLLYYNVRMKEHNTVNWNDSYLTQNILYNSNSQYTTLIYPIEQNLTKTLVHPIYQKQTYYSPPDAYAGEDQIIQFPAGSQVDFQVQAMIGYQYIIYNSVELNTLNFTGQTSDWSSTETITLPSSSPSPSVPELSLLAIVPLFALTLIGVIAVRYRFNNKKRHHVA